MINFGNKIENNGATAQGRLTASEFNTLVNFVNQNASDIMRVETVMGVNYALVGGLTISYASATRTISLLYTKGGTTTALATISANDFIISSSLTSASFVTEDGSGNSGQFIKLEFSTNQTLYIDLEDVVGGALTQLTNRVADLEDRDVVLSESEFEVLASIDPDKFYYVYEDEEEEEE
jgi:hypothetical protein